MADSAVADQAEDLDDEAAARVLEAIEALQARIRGRVLRLNDISMLKARYAV
jgi:hypothetical protein